MLRDHPLARGPIPVDRAKMTHRPTPDAWKGRLQAETVDVLPLASDNSLKSEPGWCTYVDRGPTESPEFEVISGGINEKTPTAGAIWRQGNLLHFGFDLAPDAMNDAGRALLVNAIAYIARFTEDRPIMRTPSPFAGPAPEPRDRIDVLLGRPGIDLGEYLKGFVAPSMLAAADPNDRDAYRAWYAKVRDYVRADAEGKLVLDDEARAFGVAPNRPEFFTKAVAALRTPGPDAARARQLLARYAPDGPGPDAPADAWATWFDVNRPYLFFGDTGGYRWYLDRLARRRKVPTADLRGPARADPAK